MITESPSCFLFTHLVITGGESELSLSFCVCNKGLLVFSTDSHAPPPSLTEGVEPFKNPVQSGLVLLLPAVPAALTEVPAVATAAAAAVAARFPLS